MTRRPLRSLHRLLSGGAFASVLSLLLALGQQHALLHWLSHATASVAASVSSSVSPTGASGSNDLACDECLGLAAFDAASPTSAWAIGPTQAIDDPIVAPTRPTVDTPLRLAFRSRAPPPILS